MTTLSRMLTLFDVQIQPLAWAVPEPPPEVGSLSRVAPDAYLARVDAVISVQGSCGLAYRGSGGNDEAVGLVRAARPSRLIAMAPASNVGRGRDGPSVVVYQ